MGQQDGDLNDELMKWNDGYPPLTWLDSVLSITVIQKNKMKTTLTKNKKSFQEKEGRKSLAGLINQRVENIPELAGWSWCGRGRRVGRHRRNQLQ